MSDTPPPPPPPPPPGPEPAWGPPGGPPADGAAAPVSPPPHRGPDPIVPQGDQELAPQVVTLWRAGGAVPMALLLLPATAVGAAVGGAAWLAPLAVLALTAVVIGVLPGMRYRRWRWRLTDRALELEYGVVVRQVRALPYFRIQHIDVDHGPLDRWLGLARLQVHTASVTATLPGLPAGQAPGIRAALLQLAGTAVSGAQGDDAV
jgi:uncharacterized protein